MSVLPTPPVAITAETAPFWKAAASGRLELPVCDACAKPIWYPREFCPYCGSGDVTWTRLSGRGHIYSVSVVRRAPHPAYADAIPYSVAIVELDEGVRMMTNVVTDDVDALAIGQPVVAVFDRIADDQAILRFRPTTEEE
jgi:uncharacterized OB-fold protein